MPAGLRRRGGVEKVEGSAAAARALFGRRTATATTINDSKIRDERAAAVLRVTRRLSLDGGTCACVEEEEGDSSWAGMLRPARASKQVRRRDEWKVAEQWKLAALRSCECESSQSGGAAAGVQRRECASSTRAQARPRMFCFTLVQRQVPSTRPSRVSC
jgi:hypothetical protein